MRSSCTRISIKLHVVFRGLPPPPSSSRAVNMAGQGVFKDLLDGDVFNYYVDGAWTPTTSGKSVGIINPSTLKSLFKISGDVAPAIACFLSFFRCCSHLSDLHGNSARLNHVTCLHTIFWFQILHCKSKNCFSTVA